MSRQSKLSSDTKKSGGYVKKGSTRSKFNDEVETQILRALRAGGHLEIAAAAAGISPKTLYEWFRKGDQGEEPYKTFKDKCSLVMASVEVRVVRDVVNAGKHDPKYLQWWLERRFPERWAKSVNQNVSGSIKHEVEPIKVDDAAKDRVQEIWEVLPPDQRSELLDSYEIPDDR